MMRHCYKFGLFIVFLSLSAPRAFSQDLTGIWRGYFSSQSGYSQYKFELQLQQKNAFITGVSYSYLDTSFYGKATLTGSFSRASSTALVQEIKTVELRMSFGSVACIMKCKFEYVKSGREEFLEGTFSSMYETTDSLKGIIRGGNCGGGTVYLRKVPTSDFYVEPFLRNKIAARPPQIQQTPKTEKKEPPVVKTEPKTDRTETPPGNNDTKVTPRKEEPVSTIPETKPEEKRPEPELKKETAVVPLILKTRSNELTRTIFTDASDISISIYDNGEIDDDTVSVYLDNKLVLSQQRLSASPLTLKLKINSDNPLHELVLVADNLGRIPPNTSLMIVNAGDKRYEVRITSTEQKNALVRFVYRKPD